MSRFRPYMGDPTDRSTITSKAAFEYAYNPYWNGEPHGSRVNRLELYGTYLADALSQYRLLLAMRRINQSAT